MQKYRSKETFEAVKVTRENIEEVREWFKTNHSPELEGEWIEDQYLSTKQGHYLILDDGGSFWTMPPNLFETDYEPIN